MEHAESAELPEGRWWSAEVSPPLDAVVLDFVAFFYEHFDNNGGANFRAAVTFDPQHATCALQLDSWPASPAYGSTAQPGRSQLSQMIC